MGGQSLYRTAKDHDLTLQAVRYIFRWEVGVGGLDSSPQKIQVRGKGLKILLMTCAGDN